MAGMRPFTPDDLYLHQKIMDLDCAPRGALAAGTVRSVDRDNDKYLSCIWAFPLDGAPARQLTHGPGLEKSPCWSPDGGQLAFVSNRAGGAPQLYLLPRNGGEARQVADFEMGVSSLRWTPDGKNLLVTAAVRADPDARGKRSGHVPERSPNAPEVCWKLPYKSDGVGYLLQREIHLFSVDVASGECQRLSDGPFDVMGFAPSPNGRHIAYTRTREGRYANNTDLWVCDTDGTHHRRLTRGHATVMQPAWSPDGRWIAFAGAVKEGDGESRLWLLDFSMGQAEPLGPPDLEVADPQSLCWSANCERLTLLRAFRGRHEVVAVTVPGGELDVLVTGDRQIGAFACTPDHLAFSVETPLQPSELFACGPDGGAERQASQLNGWWKERTPLELTSRDFAVPDGKGGTERIQGWLLQAQGGDGPKPLLSDVHGGPGAYALLDYDTNVFWQVLCSRGWAVLMLNAVGSSSFGGDFCSRLSGHWGELDLPQHLAAVAQLQAEGVCDDRVAVAGKSYGGYLTSWAIGHTDVFRAAVVMAPVGNVETHYGTSDGGYYADPLYIGTAPDFERERARRLSPLQYVEQAVTPTLFLQGKDDERCPKCQSEELFVSLYRAGDTPAELVLYPNEDHHFLGEGRPGCRADAARRIIDWVTRYAGQALPRRAADPVPAETDHYESATG
jgi:dipeptidyl aminopeptidase/acylaminoacyl peptidase